MPPYRYRLSANLKRDDASKENFELRISEPAPHKKFGFQVLIQCPQIRSKPLLAYGDEPERAFDNGLRLVARWLELVNAKIVDDDETEIVLPVPDDDLPSATPPNDSRPIQDEMSMIAAIDESEDGHVAIRLDDAVRIGDAWHQVNTHSIFTYPRDMTDGQFAQIGREIVTWLRIRKGNR